MTDKPEVQPINPGLYVEPAFDPKPHEDAVNSVMTGLLAVLPPGSAVTCAVRVPNHGVILCSNEGNLRTIARMLMDLATERGQPETPEGKS